MKQEAVPFQIVILILSLKNIVTLKSALGVTHQGRSQKFAKRGGGKTGGLGNGSPPTGSRGRAPVGALGRRPQKLEIYTECITIF